MSEKQPGLLILLELFISYGGKTPRLTAQEVCKGITCRLYYLKNNYSKR